MTKQEKQKLEDLLAEKQIFLDKIVWKRDSRVVLRQTYFYHHRKTAEGWGKRIEKAVDCLKVIETNDIFREWPKDSYFEVIAEVDREKLNRQHKEKTRLEVGTIISLKREGWQAKITRIWIESFHLTPTAWLEYELTGPGVTVRETNTAEDFKNNYLK